MLAIRSRLSSICSCETGTLLFALLNMMLWTPGVIKGLYNFLYSYFNKMYIPYPYYFELAVNAEVSLLFLMFAVILLYGILKKRSGPIKAYLVLGVSALCLSGFMFLVYLPITAHIPIAAYLPVAPVLYFWTWSPRTMAMIVITQVVYTFSLAMIYNAYKKLKDAEDLSEHYNKVINVQPTGLTLFSICSFEIGTIIFASFNLMFALTGVFGGFTAFAVCYFTEYYYDHRLELLICTEISLFSMIFAAFLLHGVLKKNVQHIKVYLTMGTVMLVLSFVVGSLVFVPIVSYYFIETHDLLSARASGVLALIIILQVVYALILAMINVTYQKIKTASINQNEQQIFLVQNMDKNLSTPVHKLLC